MGMRIYGYKAQSGETPADEVAFTPTGGIAATDVQAAIAEVDSEKASISHKDTHDPQDGSDPLDTAAPSELAGVQAAAIGSSHSLARSDHAHQIQHGITDNHIVTVDHDGVVSGDYAKFTANGLEGRSASETFGDVKQAASTEATGVLEISTDAEALAQTATDKALVPSNLPGILAYRKVVTVTDDDIVLTSAYFGKSVRMSSAADHIATLPSVGADEDGAKIRIVKCGAGKVTIDAADSDTINDSGAGDTIYNDEAGETYAFVDLEYVHALTKWIASGTGTWITTD